MTYYHQIFENNNSFNTEEQINLFHKYFPISLKEFENSVIKVPDILEDSVPILINIPVENITVCSPPIQNVEKPKSKVNRSILTNMTTAPKDLFWQIYIGVYGLSRYIQIKRGYANEEINEKQKIIEYMKNNGNTIKGAFTKKITKVQIQEMMSSIITSKSFQITDLFALSVYYNHRIIITKKIDNGMGVYLDFCPNIENLNDNVLVIYKNKGEFILEEKNEYETIISNSILLESYEKSLKAISNYKVSELNELANKVGVVMSVKYTKQELYMEILRLIGSF